MRIAIIAALAALLGACFNPDYPANLGCDPTGWCPPGQTCNVRNKCVPNGTVDGDGGTVAIDGSPADAGLGALTAIDIGADVTIAVSGTYQFTILGIYENGTQEITDFAIWESSDMSVMYVDYMGVAHGEAAGTATATARYGGRVDTALVTVTP